MQFNALEIYRIFVRDEADVASHLPKMKISSTDSTASAFKGRKGGCCGRNRFSYTEQNCVKWNQWSQLLHRHSEHSEPITIRCLCCCCEPWKLFLTWKPG